ncbi:MAG: hypothetical protein AAGA48_17475 [Myxococcota bacterium]
MSMVWFVVLGFGCGNPNYPPENPLEFEFRSCKVDEDCTILELGCCDECNGGFAVAVTQGQETAALDEYGESGCGNAGCDLLSCSPLIAQCINELCVVDRSAREP